MAKHFQSKASPDGMKPKSLTPLIRLHVDHRELSCIDQSREQTGIPRVRATLSIHGSDGIGGQNNGVSTVEMRCDCSAKMRRYRIIFSEIVRQKISCFLTIILQQKTAAVAPMRPGQLSGAIGSNFNSPAPKKPIAGSVGQTAIYATQFVPA